MVLARNYVIMLQRCTRHFPSARYTTILLLVIFDQSAENTNVMLEGFLSLHASRCFFLLPWAIEAFEHLARPFLFPTPWVWNKILYYLLASSYFQSFQELHCRKISRPCGCGIFRVTVRLTRLHGAGIVLSDVKPYRESVPAEWPKVWQLSCIHVIS